MFEYYREFARCLHQHQLPYVPSEAQVQEVIDIVENMLKDVYVFPGVAEKLKKSTPSRLPLKKHSVM